LFRQWLLHDDNERGAIGDRHLQHCIDWMR
jgi:hypothetical protein